MGALLLLAAYRATEEVHVELLELGPGQSLREVLTLKQGLNLHASLHLRALSKGVFPSSSLKSGLALSLKGFKLRCLQFYLGQNFHGLLPEQDTTDGRASKASCANPG